MLSKQSILPVLLALIGAAHVASAQFSGSEAPPKSGPKGRAVTRDVDAGDASASPAHPIIHKRRILRKLRSEVAADEGADGIEIKLVERVRGGASDYIVARGCEGVEETHHVDFQIFNNVWIKDAGPDWIGTGTIAGYKVCGTETLLQVKTTDQPPVNCKMKGTPAGTTPIVQFTSGLPPVKVLQGSGSFAVECDRLL